MTAGPPGVLAVAFLFTPHADLGGTVSETVRAVINSGDHHPPGDTVRITDFIAGADTVTPVFRFVRRTVELVRLIRLLQIAVNEMAAEGVFIPVQTELKGIIRPEAVIRH